MPNFLLPNNFKNIQTWYVMHGAPKNTRRTFYNHVSYWLVFGENADVSYVIAYYIFRTRCALQQYNSSINGGCTILCLSINVKKKKLNPVIYNTLSSPTTFVCIKGFRHDIFAKSFGRVHFKTRISQYRNTCLNTLYLVSCLKTGGTVYFHLSYFWPYLKILQVHTFYFYFKIVLI